MLSHDGIAFTKSSQPTDRNNDGFRHLRQELGASAAVLLTAIILDLVVLVALIAVKADSDMTVIYVSVIGLVTIFAGERVFLRRWRDAGT